LYAVDDSGAWVTSTFTDLEPLMAAVQAAMNVDEPVALLHVGFWLPTVQEVAVIAAQHPGSLIVSDSASAALSGQLVVSAAAIGCVRGVVLRLAIDGQFARSAGLSQPAASTEVAESKAWSPAAQFTSAVVPAPRVDWLAALASSDPDLFERTAEAGVTDDKSYLALEAALPRTLRRGLGLARWALISGASPDIETVLETLWASPPWFMDVSLVSLGLTVRQANVFRTHNLQKVADISALGPMGLLKLPNLGSGSVHGLRKLLLEALEAAGAQLPAREDADSEQDADAQLPKGLESLRSGFMAVMALLSEVERQVWAGRLGLDCPQLTLQELADSMGVTRERVRQIEAQAYRRVEHRPFWRELGSRLDDALRGRTGPLLVNELPATETWFAEAPSLAAPLTSAVRHLLAERFGAFPIGGEWVVSHLRRQEWNEVCQSARNLLESCARDRVEEDVVRWQVDQLLNGRGEELRPVLWSEATAKALWSARPGQPRRLVSLDDDAQSVVLAVLESADEPLHYSEICRRALAQYASVHDAKSLQNAAQTVGILFGRGAYGLPHHSPLTTDELALVRAEIEDVVAGGDHARQWHSSELCDALLERGMGFDGRLNKYVVNHALKGCSGMVDLRRMVWGLDGAWQAGAASRLDVRQAVIGLLESHGRPMSTAEVRACLAAVRGVNQTFQIFPSDPLVRIGPGIWGLLHRDVDVTRARHLVTMLRDVLLQRQSGLHVTELAEAPGLDVAAAGLPEASWLTVADSAGIRVDRGQYAYLAEWGASRRLAVPEAVRAAVADVGSCGAVLEDICAHVNRLTQREVPSGHVSQALRGLDLSYDPTSRLWGAESSEAPA
jgi:hypothetical protein